MAPFTSLAKLVLFVLCVSNAVSKPRKFSKRDISTVRNKRQEILPQDAFYNPGSQEVSRLSFEDQNAETDNRFYQTGNAQSASESQPILQDNDLMKEANSLDNEKESAEAQKEFLAQSEVQKSSIGEYAANQEVRDNMIEAAKSYETEVGLNEPSSLKQQRNPFEMPAGYPDQDGYKKSLVSKQNLPLNEPHPEGSHQHVTDNAILTHENNSWYGVSRYPPTKIPPQATADKSKNAQGQTAQAPSVVAGISMPANARPSEYKVSVSQNENKDGYVAASQIEAQYPIGQLPSYPPATAYYQAGGAENKVASANQTKVSSVEYAVPPSQNVYNAWQQQQQQITQQQPQQQKQQPAQQQPAQQQPQQQQPQQQQSQQLQSQQQQPQQQQLQQQTSPQQPQKQQLTKQEPVKTAATEKLGSDILDLKLEKRPIQQQISQPLSQNQPVAPAPVPAPVPAPAPAPYLVAAPPPAPLPQKVPSAKNYPIDLILLNQPAKTASPVSSGDSHQLTSVTLTKPAPSLAGTQQQQSGAIQKPVEVQQSVPAPTAQKPSEVIQGQKQPQALPAAALPNQEQMQTKPLQPQLSSQQLVYQSPQQQGAQLIFDDPFCANYPLSRCGEEWLKKNCPIKCKGRNTTCAVPSTGGTGRNGCCSFPFYYNGQPYYSCIMNPGQVFWCGTTLNVDKDGLWGYCAGCPYYPCPPLPTTAAPYTTVSTTYAPYTTATNPTRAPVNNTTPFASTTAATTTQYTTPPSSTTATTMQTTTTAVPPTTTVGTTTALPPTTTQTKTPITTTATTQTATTPLPTTTTQATTKPNPPTTTTETTTQATTTASPLETTASTSKPTTRTVITTTKTITKGPERITTTNAPKTTPPTFPPTSPTLGCGPWSDWTNCDKSCEGGKKYRYRNCTKAVLVKEVEVETQPCNTQSCALACGNWTQWSECSATCGYGFKQRFRNCSFNGGDIKVFVDRKQCYVADCPADCKPWTKWTECSKSCGKGSQARYRNCTLTDGIESFSRVFYEDRVCNPDPCPPVCEQWSSWTPCTKSCGEGTQYRYTNCKLDNGDKMTYYDHRVCNTQDCPPVCGNWGKWSECTKTCGGGSQHRVRNCSIDSHGKNKTFGEGEVQECNIQPCELKYNCSDWGPWTECSATCNGGERMRIKQCHRDDGLIIYQPELEICNKHPCEKVCGEWSAFTMCSSTCGGGYSERWRTCDGNVEVDSVACNTFPCSTAPPPTTPSTTPSPIPTTSPNVCSVWSNWSECSATCNGLQSRIRHCKNSTHEHDELQARPCNTLPCPGNATTPATTPATTTTTTAPSTTPFTTTPAPQCTEWSQWSQCTQSCGGGYQERFRTCSQYEQQIESRICNTQPCPTPSTTSTPKTTPQPRPGPYPDCLLAYLSFDRIDQQNKIVYDEGPYHNDAQLDGNLTFVNGNFSCGFAVKLNGGEIMFDGSKFNPKPTQAITVAAWIFVESNVDRQTIFATRAGGQDKDNFFLEIEQGKIRWYHIDPVGKTVFFVVTESLLPAKTWIHIAGSYDVRTGQVRFFINAEESKVTQGQGPLTQDWDTYAKIAGGGSGTQFKGLIDEFYIFNCSLVDEQVRVVADTCKLREGTECPSPLLGVCPPCENCTTAMPPTTKPNPEESIDGGYGSWSNWTKCSVTCGMGTRMRHRECDTPEPQNGGLNCIEVGLGPEDETTSCDMGPCSVDGNWGAWGQWSACSVTCGIGYRSHWRECNSPKPANGGKTCEGADMAQDECRQNPCPINGNYTSWTGWTECSVTCGNGTQSRQRDCANPGPKYGGKDCSNLGPSEEIQACLKDPCPRDGMWSNWSPWSECSKTCGDGKMTRERKCDSPPPANGGAFCAGNATAAIYCKQAECCDISYMDIGCFKDSGAEPRPLPQLIFTDRDPKDEVYSGIPVHGQDFDAYVTDLICRCAKASKEKKFTHFAIQQYGECLSGPNVAKTYYAQGKESEFRFRPDNKPWIGCMDTDFKKCQQPSSTCVGQELTNFVYGLENVTAIDGNYTEWSEWSGCSVTCGEGQQSRVRECTNPKPAFGGRNCSHIGEAMEVKPCNKMNCEVPANWGRWSNWTACSVSCGEGFRQRTRECDNPTPVAGAPGCPGPNTQTETCENQPCPVNCSWSEWSQWSRCSVTCGDGVQIRHREDDDPPAMYGGDECVGPATDIQQCYAGIQCPINGNYTNWSDWGQCSRTCGGGYKSRSRTCTNPAPSNGGKDCSELGPASENKECGTAPCAQNGNYSQWSDWSACDKTCGLGMQMRSRKCNNPPPLSGGKNCSFIGPAIEYKECNMSYCPVDGNFTQWTSWTTCSKTCGAGRVYRSRKCSNPVPQYGGKFCMGNDTESKPCNLGSCCQIPYKDIGCFADVSQLAVQKPLPELLFDDSSNLDYQNFDQYIEEVICLCANAAYQKQYTHFSIQSLSKCYSGPNVAKTYKKDGSASSCAGRGGSPSSGKFEPCKSPDLVCVGREKSNYVYGLANVTAVNGNYTAWSTWTECNAQCGPGVRSRYRTCTKPVPAFGGKDCSAIGEADQEEPCEVKKCPIDGKFSEWTSWSLCSPDCGEGKSLRYRQCNAPAPAYGGLNCTGNYVEEQECHLPPCPVDGNYTEWGEFSPCVPLCGNGTQIRQRTCTNPRPAHGGKSCLEQGMGDDTEERGCTNGPCIQDGNWCEWAPWSLCSKTCGQGSRNRTRACACPSAENGGQTCPGSGEEAKSCILAGCPVNGNYTAWTAWTACDKSCGNGTRTRSRSCNSPSPANGGKTCIEQGLGEDTENEECFLVHCPVNGNFSEWSEWSHCSKTCGAGLQSRERTCNNPAPKFGGLECVGEKSQQKYCKMGECCDVPYKDIGCFADNAATVRPLPEMLFNDEAKRKTESWEEFLPDIICSCAKAAKEKKYLYFGIQNFAECWSGPNGADTYKLDGASEKCVSTVVNSSYAGNVSKVGEKYETCVGDNLVCSGKLGANYVYGLENVTVVDGNYTEWSSWGNCSVNCGGGVKERQRTCTNPKPSFGGKDCNILGPDTSTAICNTNPCPVDGNWGGWSQWSACSVSCGNGTVKRTRACDNPPAQHGGDPCFNPASFEQVSTCSAGPCPVDGHCLSWGSWSACSVTCGVGNKTRTRNCTEPLHGGKVCTCSKKDSESCKITDCPVNGNWGNWSPWSSCSVSCGSGVKNRSRACDSPEPKFGGRSCNGSKIESSNCNEIPCPIDGNYTEWSTWTECSVTCGGGAQTRSRYCENPEPQNNGKDCTEIGQPEEKRECNNQPCPQDGGFSEWSLWSSCSADCGEGIQNITRTCTNPEPKYNGSDCIGERSRSKACKIQDCCKTPYKRLGCYSDKGGSRPLPQLLFDVSANASKLVGKQWNVYLLEMVCKCAEEAKQRKYTHFGLQDYGKCYSGPDVKNTFDKDGLSTQCVSKSPESGVKSGEDSHLKCTASDSHCAGVAGANFVYGLDYPAVDGNYTEWSQWSPCSKSCGTGETYRARNCTNPVPSFGGKNCSLLGADEEVKPCQVVPCPVNGNWGPWSPASECSVTCGNGTMTRNRQCNNPSPLNGGETCPGSSTVTILCNLRPCPIDGGWSEWTDWSKCSKTCGEGEKQRSRQCNNPTPNEYGKQCEGKFDERDPCNLEPCYGKLSQWGQWSQCSHTCGDGTRSRYRTCEGGDTCSGDLSEIEACNVQSCPSSCDKKFDLGFLHDVSGNHYDQVKKFILSLTSTLTISQAATRVSYLAFSTKPDDIIAAFNMHNSQADFDANIKTSIQGGITYINVGLTKANTTMFSIDNGDRPDVPDILVVLTDGDQSVDPLKNTPTLEEAANALKKRGITLMVVGAGEDSNFQNTTLATLSSESKFIFRIGSYNDIYKLIYNVSTAICSVEGGKWSEWTSWSNCSASCGNGTRERTRYCQGGVAGSGSCTGNANETTVCNNKPCVVPTTAPKPFKCSAVIDLAFVIDSSSSITDHWGDLKQFIMKVIDAFTIGNEGVLISIVTYSDQPRKVFGFDPLKTKELLKLDVSTLAQMGGGTRIDSALRFTAENVFTDKGDRPGIPDVAVVLTDGKSDPGSEPLEKASEPLREKGIHVISVGLGNDIDIQELSTITTHKDKKPFLIKDLTDLVNYIEALAKEICLSVYRPRPKKIYTGYGCQPSLILTFDRVCGKTVYDESGQGNNGQIFNTANIAGDVQQCGKNLQMVERGGVKIDGPSFRNKPASAITMSAWLNPYSLSDTGTVQQVFIAKDSKEKAQISLQVIPEGKFHVLITNGNETVFSCKTVAKKIAFFTWVHVAFSLDVATKKYAVYINRVALSSSDLEEVKTDGPKFFSMDWGGLVAIGADDESVPKAQFLGLIDQVYMFPCVLSAADISLIGQSCSEYFPFSGAFPGANYRVYGGVKSNSLAALQQEVQQMKPIFETPIKHAIAPAFNSIKSKFTSNVGNAAFAAMIYGYFVPPITGNYKFTIEGHFQGMLSFSVETKSIESGIEKKTEFNGDTTTIRSANVSAEMLAGRYYYYEVLQLSSDEMNKLTFNFTMRCSDGSDICTSNPIQDSYLQSKIASNCTDIADQYDNLPDDDYVIRMSSSCDVSSIYCRNMQSTDQLTRAMEYVTLASGANENFAMYYRPRLQNYATCSGPENPTPMETTDYWGQTWFKRIRVNRNTLQIDTKDFTFATSKGRQMEYGRAGDCYSKSTEDCRKGQFKINLDGTSLKLDGKPQWKATGMPEDDFRITQFIISPDNAVVSARCGGSCSECMPADHLRLKPQFCFNAAAQQQQQLVPPPVSSPKKTKRSVKEKRVKRDKKEISGNRWWKWWPF